MLTGTRSLYIAILGNIGIIVQPATPVSLIGKHIIPLTFVVDGRCKIFTLLAIRKTLGKGNQDVPQRGEP